MQPIHSKPKELERAHLYLDIHLPPVYVYFVKKKKLWNDSTNPNLFFLHSFQKYLVAIVLIAGTYLIVCDAGCFYQKAKESEEPVKGKFNFFHPIVKLNSYVTWSHNAVYVTNSRTQTSAASTVNLKSCMESLQPPQPSGKQQTLVDLHYG